MFQPWRLKLREAEQALDAGRLEEASQLLSQPDVREFLPAKKLLAQVASRMAQRAERNVNAGQTQMGWRDLEAASALGADAEKVRGVQQQLVERALEEARALLAAGEPQGALDRIARLEKHATITRDVRLLREAAQRVDQARRLSSQGKFSAADEHWAAAAALVPDLPQLAEMRKVGNERAKRVRVLTEQLHSAIGHEAWTAAVSAADELLQLCPAHDVARQARRKAWEAAGMNLADTMAPKFANDPTPVARRRPRAAEASPAPQAEVPIVATAEPGPRYVLWVDGVGGYLVCLGEEVVLGQPAPGNAIDVPILADISARHAVVRRDGEGYLIEAIRPVRINGRQVSGAATLADGALVELGGGVKLRFHSPHALSRTARLEFVSHHRTRPSTDGVLLLADACILGPAATSHVVCPYWPHDVVLYRQGGEISCRSVGKLKVDGREVEGHARLQGSSRVEGDDFSLSLEAL